MGNGARPNFRTGLGHPPSQMAAPLAVPARPFVGGGHPIVAKLGKRPDGYSLGLLINTERGDRVVWGTRFCRPLVHFGIGPPLFSSGKLLGRGAREK